MDKAVCIIPARGGSQRIPNKNIRELCGKPIIAYAIEAAMSAECFDEVMVSTDSETIASIAEKHGANVPFFRSKENASDFATTVAVWREVLSHYREQGRVFSLAGSILPTALFVTGANLREVMRLLSSHSQWDAVMSVVAYSSPIQRAMKLEDGELRMLAPEHVTTRSQDLETCYHDAGQYYAFRADFVLRAKSLREGRLGAVVVPAMQAQDIDTEDDWILAELKYRLWQSQLRSCT
jgi:pseudaminic acid cytidylyltransferase